MAINYEPVGWDTTKHFNPTNMNHMDGGIKAACDKVDKHDSEIDEINSNFNIEPVSFTPGKCVNSGSIIRIGHLYVGNFVLTFTGLDSNVEYTIASNLPTFRSGIELSVPNEYGQPGVCTITIKDNSIVARCTESNSFYYANFVWLA